MTVRTPQGSPLPAARPAAPGAPAAPPPEPARPAGQPAGSDGFSLKRPRPGVPGEWVGPAPGPSVERKGRTAAEAVAAADQLLHQGARGAAALEGGQVTSNPTDVNDHGLLTERILRPQAEAMLAANAELERQALDRLTPEQRARYLAVQAALKDADDPLARLSLQKMLLAGELPGAKALGGDRDVLEGLYALATQPLAPGIERADLLCHAVRELGCPSAVSQQHKGTCAATVVIIHLLRTNPAEYLRLLGGLASPEGSVQLAGGQVLQREPGTDADDGSGRSVPQRLLAPAFMEYANEVADYDNASDTQQQQGEDPVRGLTSAQVDHLLEGVYGVDHAFGFFDPGSEAASEAWRLIQQELAAGRTVFVGLVWPPGSHKVLLTGKEVVDGVKYVAFINPWGQEERLPEAELLGRLLNVNYLAEPPPTAGGIGGGGGSW